MTIEILKKEDIVLYKNLIDECFGDSNPIEYYENNYKDSRAYEIVVAKKENEIIGSITFQKIDLFTFGFQPALMIFNVCVLEKYRGQKIAHDLFNYIVRYAKNNGYKSISLTCFENARSAHRLYESIGFTRSSSVKYDMNL